MQRHRVGGARASEVVQVVQMRWYRDAGVGGAEIQVQTACSILGAGADLGPSHKLILELKTINCFYFFFIKTRTSQGHMYK